MPKKNTCATSGASVRARDLGADQRAIIIAKLRLPALKAEAKERQKAGLKRGQAPPRPAKSGGTEARDVAAKLSGVSHTKIDAAAKLVRQEAPGREISGG